MEISYADLVRPITKLFDDDANGVDLNTIQVAIERLEKLKEDGEDYLIRLDHAISDLQGLHQSKLSSNEPIDLEDLLIDADNCVTVLREI